MVPVPNLRKNRSRAGASIARGLGDIVKSTLKDGGNVIFYPSGHIQTECGCEDIGTRQLAHNICGDLPEKVRVIGVRTTGLWGGDLVARESQHLAGICAYIHQVLYLLFR